MSDYEKILSPAALAVLELNENAAYTKLVINGAGSEQARPLLAGLGDDKVLACGLKAADPQGVRGVLAGLWLWQDCLAESHAISQGLRSETGSFWHAIMHRREGDFSNSQYWYARCRNHPVLTQMTEAAQSVLPMLPGDARLAKVLQAGGWDPNAFVDFVQEAHFRGPDDADYAAAVRLQQVEWHLLFDHCVNEAAPAT